MPEVMRREYIVWQRGNYYIYQTLNDAKQCYWRVKGDSIEEVIEYYPENRKVWPPDEKEKE